MKRLAGNLGGTLVVSYVLIVLASESLASMGTGTWASYLVAVLLPLAVIWTWPWWTPATEKEERR